MNGDIERKLLPKQYRFLCSHAREVLYSGAYRAGKSYALCAKLSERASIPGAREGLCRKYLSSLKATTLHTLLEGDGLFPPVLLPGSYDYNQSSKTIKLHDGGEIIYFGVVEPAAHVTAKKIGSLSLTGCAIDEAEELSGPEYTALRGRVSVDVPGLMQQLYSATNPGSPSHHLAIRFGLGGGNQCTANCEAIVTCSRDNHHLNPEYLADLDTFTGVAYKRYVLGQWVGSDKLVYDTWDREKFVKECPPYEWLGYRRIVIGCDEGYTNPAVFLMIGEDNDGRYYVFKEWYKTKQLPEDVVRVARSLFRRFNASGEQLPSPDRFIMDPAAAGLIASLRAAGLPVTEGINDVMPGIQRIRDILVVGGDGRPRLTVDPSCVNTIREFETYEMKPEKDEPTRENDHACSALRYAIFTLTKGISDNIRPWGESVKSEARVSKQFHAEDVTDRSDPIGGSVEFRERTRDDD